MLRCYTDEYRHYFEKEASYWSEILTDMNCHKYEMLIEREFCLFCLYFTAFLNNRQQPASD